METYSLLEQKNPLNFTNHLQWAFPITVNGLTQVKNVVLLNCLCQVMVMFCHVKKILLFLIIFPFLLYFCLLTEQLQF